MIVSAWPQETNFTQNMTLEGVDALLDLIIRVIEVDSNEVDEDCMTEVTEIIFSFAQALWPHRLHLVSTLSQESELCELLQNVLTRVAGTVMR